MTWVCPKTATTTNIPEEENNMKQLTKIALTGALALGGLAGTSVADIPNLSPIAAEAATATTVTDWSGYKESQLALDVNASLAESDRAYKYGDSYLFGTTELSNQDMQHVKIYRVGTDSTLTRYKTMLPEQHSMDSFGNYPTFYSTTITTGFPAGNYYAVHTYTENGATKAERSYRFTISN